MTRIMMHVGGENRPLSMGGNFTSLPTDGRAACWSGLPIEQHRMDPWEGDAEVGPLGGEQGGFDADGSEPARRDRPALRRIVIARVREPCRRAARRTRARSADERQILLAGGERTVTG